MRGPYGPPASWQIKPPLGSQINAGHELAYGIQECYLFNEGGGKTVQNIGPSGVGPLTISSGFTWPANLAMPYMRGAAVGAASQTCTTPATVTLGNQVSLVVAFARTASGVANGVLVACRNSNLTANQIILQNDGTASGINVQLDDQSGVAQIMDVTSPAVVTNTPSLMVATFDRVAGNMVSWLNNVQNSRSGSALTAQNLGTFVMSVGSTPAGGGLQPLTAALLIKYNRLLSAAEAQQLYVNPYCMFAPQALRRYWVGAAGGAAFAQTLAATQGSTPAFVRGVGKSVAASQGSTPTLIKGTGHALAATQGSTPTLTKGRARTLPATQATIPLIVRGTGKTITATQGATPLLTRGVGKVLSATQGATATMLALKTKIVTLAATQGATATMGRSVGKVLAAVQASSVTTARGIGHSMAATQSTSAGLSKGRARTLATTQGSSAAMTRGAAKNLAATQGTTARMQRAIGKTMTATQAATVTLSRGMARTLAATQGSSAALARGVGKALVATQAQTVTVLASRAGALPVLVARATMTMVGVPTATMRLLLVPTATMTMEER